MSRKEKPATAGTDTRVDTTEQAHHTPTSDQLQCPRCKLTGDINLFEPGWPDRLHEFIARYPGLGITGDLASMDYQDARYLFNWLDRMGG